MPEEALGFALGNLIVVVFKMQGTLWQLTACHRQSSVSRRPAISFAGSTVVTTCESHLTLPSVAKSTLCVISK